MDDGSKIHHSAGIADSLSYLAQRRYSAAMYSIAIKESYRANDVYFKALRRSAAARAVAIFSESRRLGLAAGVRNFYESFDWIRCVRYVGQLPRSTALLRPS